MCPAENLDALARLRRAGWRIGIVTNGMTDNQLAKIRNTGPGSVVDGWGNSQLIGVRKPDPEIFRHVARRCHRDPDDGGWMTGDSRTHDVAGGHAAGLRTIWLPPSRRPAARSLTAPAPDHLADSVVHAVDILEHRS